MPLIRSLRRVLPALLVGALLGVVPTAVAPPPATATSVYLCNGYAGCRDAGYPNAGYGAHNDQMYWGMYAGHNCTNYVAYRMIRAGMSPERPWSGTGMAYNWGLARNDITDKVPAVGAVAWWNRGVSGAGSSGHVAIVERVLSPTRIVISEDSWSGDFHWRTIVNDGNGWPTGFIHFVDKTVSNTLPPRIVGTPRVGDTLTARPGSWEPASKVAYQWRASGKKIAGAVAKTFTPTAAQLGQPIAVTVTATRAGYAAASKTTAPTAPVARGVITNVTPPTLSGDPVVGQVLRVTHGSWSPAPQDTVFRWRANGAVLPDRSESTLTLDASLVGKKITVVEAARRDGYTRAKATSNRLGPVLAGIIEARQPFAASGATRVGSTLTMTPGTVSPSDARVAYSWLRDGVPVEGATAPTYDVTATDLGHHLTARVTATKPHYRPLGLTYLYARSVTTKPRLKLRTDGKSRAAAVRVHVSAPGVSSPTGRVTVRIGEHTVRGALVDGRVRLLVTDLKPGDRRVVVSYAGTSVIEAGQAVTRVWVRR